MYISNEIRDIYRNINKTINEIDIEKYKQQSKTNNSRSWWESESGDVFREENKELLREIEKIQSQINNSQTKVRKIEDVVERAEREKRQKEMRGNNK